MPLIAEATDQKHDVTGQPIFHYRQEPLDASKPVIVLYDARIPGVVRLADGTTYSTEVFAVEVESKAHEAEFHHLHGLRLEAEGHPLHKPRGYRAKHDQDTDYDPLVDEFHHVCGPVCGEHARTPEQQAEDFKGRLISLGHGHRIGTPEHQQVLDALAAAHAHVNQEG